MNSQYGESSPHISLTPPRNSSERRLALSHITNHSDDHSRRSSCAASLSNESAASCPASPSARLTPDLHGPASTEKLHLDRSKPIILASEKQPRSTVGIELVHDPSPGPYARICRLKFEGYGEIIAARELDLQWITGRSCGRIVALKVFGKKTIEEEELEHVVLNELDAYQKVEKSRGLGKGFIMWPGSSFETPEHVVFLMDFLPWTLSDILLKDRGKRQDFKRRWVAQMARGISAIHIIGLIHRDIRPENIFLDEYYNVRIGGFARVYVHPGDKVNIDDLQSSDIVGTWPYMAPEIVKLAVGRRKEPYSTAVDYWSLGCIVYELESTTRKHRPMFKRYRDVVRYAAYQAIEVPYPPFEGISEDAQSLLSGLVCFDPDERMGNIELRQHPYFKSDSGANEFNKLGKAPSKRSIDHDIPWVEINDETARQPVVYRPVDRVPSKDEGKIDFSQFRWNCPTEAPVKRPRKSELVLFSC